MKSKRVRCSGVLVLLCAACTTVPDVDSAIDPEPEDETESEPVEAASTAIKFHPGHYAWVDPLISRTNAAAQKTAVLGAIDAIANEPVAGVAVLIYWGALEGNTAGDYHEGFQLVDELVARAKLRNKRLMIGVVDRIFGGYAPSSLAAGAYFPSYLAATAYNGGWVRSGSETWTGGLTVMTRMWEAPVMDRFIALTRAYGARYNAHPHFEAWYAGESAVGVPSSFGYSGSAYIAQLKRLFPAARAAFPNTALRFCANFLSANDATFDALLAIAAANRISIGGPDPELPLPVIERTIKANRLFRGLDGGHDLRGKVPWFGEQQALGYEGVGHGFDETPAEIFTYQAGTMRAQYMVWLRNGWAGNSGQRWTTGILPYLRSIQGKVANSAGQLVAPASVPCPTGYAGGCTR